ncbi:MAG TPA: recombinase family protein [Acidimicrobiales bacterium]|nr:recombinase family protein [Acidimicrobiales bacterium]
MRAAAIYIRISSDRGGTRAGVRRQLEDCQAWAQRNGAAVAEVYEDNDASAYRGRARPAYRRMCEDIKGATRDGVIVWHNDRLHRNSRELEDFIDIVEAAGVAVATVTSGDYDLTTTTGRAMARIACALARLESEDKSRRIKRQALQAAREGKRSGGGTRAYGYHPGHQRVVPAEAAVIKEAARRLLAGEPLRSVTRDLNDRGIPTVSGRPWTSTVLRRMLTSGRISGQREHLGEIVASGDWPAIVTPAQTARLRSVLLDPDRRTNRAPRRYPLTGLVHCGGCGARLVARPRDDGERRYLCAKGPGLAGCGGTAILAEPLENFIAEAVLHRLDTPRLQRAVARTLSAEADADVVQQELEEVDTELENLATLHGQGQITVKEWMAARKPIETRREQAARRLGQLSGASALDGFVGRPGALRAQWAHLDPARQRAIIGTVLPRIVIHRAVRGRNRFDPDRIEPVWRA